MKRSLPVLAAVCGVVVGLSGCVNLFDPIDNPSGDEQILSAARAAFDKGDVAQARELYGKIAGNEDAKAELIFVDMDGCGANIEAFGTALGTGTNATASPGILFTVMAEKMVQAHGTSCLATLLSAYQRSRALTNTRLRGFVSFMAAMSIAGEVLAHNTGAQDGTLKKSDYVVEAACPACAGSACAVSDGISTQATVDLSLAASIGATFGVIHGAVTAMQTSLSEMEITSSGAAFALMQQIVAFGAGPGTETYRCALEAVEVGRP
jgi:hypothetical protein